MPGRTTIIAIDGPAASGKGTLAVKVAHHYRLPHLDTGLLYRAVARILTDRGLPLTNVAAARQAARDIGPAILTDPRLRDRIMGEAASVVAVIGDVRSELVDYQRRFAHQPGGAVLDGRDIGTVICPNAHVKLFVTASVEERANRRHKELIGRGQKADFGEILQELRRRDERDANRATAPLKVATDALLIDSTCLDAAATLQTAIDLIDCKISLLKKH